MQRTLSNVESAAGYQIKLKEICTFAGIYVCIYLHIHSYKYEQFKKKSKNTLRCELFKYAYLFH